MNNLTKVPDDKALLEFDMLNIKWVDACDTFNFHADMAKKAASRMIEINKKIYPMEKEYGLQRTDMTINKEK